ncbi:MAG: alpha/beta hydrolase [Pseudomonadota bacterium]
MKLVLLPGMDGTGDLFASFVDALPAPIEPAVVAYPVDQTLSYAQLTALVRDRLPTDEPFAVLGESFSGPIAIRLAAEQPTNLKGVVLCCTFASNPQPLLASMQPLAELLPIQRVPNFLTSFALLGAAANEKHRADLSTALDKVTESVLSRRLQAIATVDVRKELSAVAVPMLYLQATKDRLVPRAAADRLRQQQRRIEVISIDGPHMLLQTQPTVAADVVCEFLDRLPC